MAPEVLGVISALGVAAVGGITAVSVALINAGRKTPTTSTAPAAVPGIPVSAPPGVDLVADLREQRDFWRDRCAALEALLATTDLHVPPTPARPARSLPEE